MDAVDRVATVRRWLGSLVLLAFGVATAGLLLEGLVLLFFGEQPKFPRHVVGSAFGLRINEPSARYRHKSADVTIWLKINGQGFRSDREYRYEKEPGTKRIVVLGDSYTIGYEVPSEATYASVLESSLRARGYPAEVLNAGVSGYSNAEEYLYLERELLKYQPDAVVMGFYGGNDLVDNVRTNLFRLENGQLVESASSYVPMGRLANFLNTNPFFNLLSERSNAFVFLKERLTDALKKDLVQDNLRTLEQAESKADPSRKGSYERLLGAAIFERLYETTRARHISLIILSIPTLRGNPNRLIDGFPFESFPVDRPAFAYISAKELLEPHLGKELLYWTRSHYHWTPFAHRQAGEALADRIVGQRLLDGESN